MKKNSQLSIFIIGLFIVSSPLFTMFVDRMPTLLKKYPFFHRQTIKRLKMAQSTLAISQGAKKVIFSTYLVPTALDLLLKLDLWPLFKEPEHIELDPLFVKERTAELELAGVSKEEIAQEFASLSTNVGPQCHVFKENRLLSSGQIGSGFEGEDVDAYAPCIVSLGIVDGCDRFLMQLKTLDQMELAAKSGLSAALCAGHSLNNCRLMNNYAISGDTTWLAELHNIDKATTFLTDLKIQDWLNVEMVKENIMFMGKLLGSDVSDISAISTVALFDSDLDKKPGFGVYSQDEFEYVQALKAKMQKGLKEENYLHFLVIGNEEAAVAQGHYFAFVIIKKGNEIQYIVLDTMPSVYHLQEGSHERNRLMFVIDNIEKGSSSIVLANLRTRAEFMESKGEQNEESKLEKALIEERITSEMLNEKTIDVQGEISELNLLSQNLTRFGRERQLAKETKDDLLHYLRLIEIVRAYADPDAYVVLKKLIEKQLATQG